MATGELLRFVGVVELADDDRLFHRQMGDRPLGLFIARPGLLHPVPAGDGLVELLALYQGQGALAVDVGVFGIDVQRTLQIEQLRFVVAGVARGSGQARQRGNIPGIDRQNLQAVWDRLVPLALRDGLF